jgi:RNA-directed DNA polymerase
MLTSIGCFVAREFEEPLQEGMQMGTVPWTVYAPTRRKEHWKLPVNIDWKSVQLKVKRLQMRIAKAAKLKKYRLMRSLQWLLAHSSFAKLLAIRQVTSNKGKNTPGVDGVVWKTSHQKIKAIKQLRRRGYKALPLRRVYIPKKSGKLRPLGIPTMRDRAMQALYALTLAPIAETYADPNSYGFRTGRSCADAIEQCFNCLSHKHSATWILEADIAACFDNISHQWLLDNIPVDKKILSQWLHAGFLDKGNLYPTLKGTPQGGIISPILMNITLDGLERTVRKSVPWNMPNSNARTGVFAIRYADDFVITGKTKELLEQRVVPAVKKFLEERGLTFSEEKTGITQTNQGFDFLGQHLRKYKNGKLIITPTRKSVQGLQSAVRLILKAHCAGDTWSMIRRLNQTIQGWCNYHRHVCASNIFNWLDSWIFWEIKRWLRRQHSNKGRRWVIKKYYRAYLNSQWSFYAIKKNPNGKKEFRDLIKAGRINIVRHVKIQSEANPYDPVWTDYFINRKRSNRDRNKDGRFVEENGWL